MLDAHERIRHTLSAAILTINYENSATRLMNAMRRVRFFLKYGYDPNQARVPRATQTVGNGRMAGQATCKAEFLWR